MEARLMNLLVKGSKLINLYTGNTYRFIEANNKSGFVNAVIDEEEKWNKYKMVYEVEQSKQLIIDLAEVTPHDKIPFYNAKGKKMFEVRNLDIVSFVKDKKAVTGRVVLLNNNAAEKTIKFTFVDQYGNDISDTGCGYTVEEYAAGFNPKGKLVKIIPIEFGAFAEVDQRFNQNVNTKSLEKKVKEKNVEVVKEEKPLNESGLTKRLAKLGFIYKNGEATTKKGLFNRKEVLVINEEYISKLLVEGKEKEVKDLQCLEAYNIAKQLKAHNDKSALKIELANAKRKATIDTTEEEKAYTQANIDRLNEAIKACDESLDELNKYRKNIVQELNQKILEVKSAKGKKEKLKQADSNERMSANDGVA